MSIGTWTELALRFFGEVTWKATALLLAVLAAAWALRWASAAIRRRLWAGTIAVLLLLPPLVSTLPPLAWLPLPPPAARQVVSVPAGPGELAPAAANPSGSARAPVAGERPVQAFGRPVVVTRTIALATPSTPPPPTAAAARSFLSPATWPRWLAGAAAATYLAGLFLALVRLVRARRRARGLLRGTGQAGAPWQVPQDIETRESDAVALPQTVGGWRGVLLLPRSGRGWPAPWREAVVAHEVAHVRGRDPLWQLLAEIARAIYWFHPLVHLAARQLRIERELAADDATLATGMRPSDYAGVLFELACIPEQQPALGAVVPLLTPGGLKARVRALLQAGRPRRSRKAWG